MPNTTITNIQAVLNTAVISTATAATADTADLAEVFDITLTKSAGKSVIEINNVSAINGTVTFSLAAGTGFWPGTAALTGSVAQGVSKVIQVEDAKFKSAAGVMALTITPASGKKLKTDHTLTLSVCQLV